MFNFNKGIIHITFMVLAVSGCGDSKELTDTDVNHLVKVLQLYNVAESGNQVFKGGTQELEEFATVFQICNHKLFAKEPNKEILTRLLIQEALYGYALRNLDNGVFEKTALNALKNPATSIGISEIFTALSSPTTTQEMIFKKDYSAFNEDASVELKKLQGRIEKVKIDRKKNSDDEYKRVVVSNFSEIACAYSDLYLGLFDYSEVDEIKTVSREAAKNMLIVVQRRAISEVSRQLKH